MNIYRYFFLILLTYPLWSFAQATTLNNPTPGGGATLKDFIYLLIEIVQLVAVPALVVAIIYAGFLIITAGGDEKQLSTGKMWVVWVLVGAAVVLGASVIADVVYGTASAF